MLGVRVMKPNRRRQLEKAYWKGALNIANSLLELMDSWENEKRGEASSEPELRLRYRLRSRLASARNTAVKHLRGGEERVH